MRSLILSVTVGCLCFPAAVGWARPAPHLEVGRAAYQENCARCHGETGKGDGPDAGRMVPRPRDFTTGTYKFRTTASGTPPTDDDLFQTISTGLAGTRMPGWSGLREDTRWQLVEYLKSLSPKFTQAQPQPVALGKDPGAKKADPAKGKQLYADLGCAACHGTLGRANGPSAAALTDDWGFAVRAANLTHGWALRGGAEPRDLVARLMTGVDGTPMPSYADTVSSADLWQLAYYLRSIQEPAKWRWTVTAAAVAAVPASPTDPAWDRAPRTDVTLWSNQYVNGQVRPASIPWAVIQAVSTPEAIAFRIGWDDPSEDRLPAGQAGGAPPDQLALVLVPTGGSWSVGSLQSWPYHLPEAQGAGPMDHPPSAGRQVVGWPRAGSPALDVIRWSAADPAAREAVAAGFDLPATSAALPTHAHYDDGRWWLTITRPVTAPDGATFSPNAAVPMALVAWDGGRGDTGRMRSVSTWINVRLMSPPPPPKEARHGSS